MRSLPVHTWTDSSSEFGLPCCDPPAPQASLSSQPDTHLPPHAPQMSNQMSAATAHARAEDAPEYCCMVSEEAGRPCQAGGNWEASMPPLSSMTALRATLSVM